FTASARLCDRLRLYAAEPIESEWPWISTLSSGWVNRALATSFSVCCAGAVSCDELYSKSTARTITDCSMMRQSASTLKPAGAVHGGGEAATGGGGGRRDGRWVSAKPVANP